MLKTNGNCLGNGSGAAMVIALIMIIVLTLIGLATSFTSIFEIKLSGNKRGLTDAFYTAEGGVQSVLEDYTNFNTVGNFVTVNPATLPVELQNELIDSKFTAPTLALPAGENFKDPPQVTIYHTTRTSAPVGSGISATGGVEFVHYIVDSTGTDQLDLALVQSNCQLREKVVRLIPSSN